LLFAATIGKKQEKGNSIVSGVTNNAHFENKIFSYFLRCYDTIPAEARIGNLSFLFYIIAIFALSLVNVHFS